MSALVRLYAVLTTVSCWVERKRLAILMRVYGMTNDCEPPVDWRVREGLPSRDQWPTVKTADTQSVRPIWVVGRMKVGPVKPVPAKFDKESL